MLSKFRGQKVRFPNDFCSEYPSFLSFLPVDGYLLTVDATWTCCCPLETLSWVGSRLWSYEPRHGSSGQGESDAPYHGGDT